MSENEAANEPLLTLSLEQQERTLAEAQAIVNSSVYLEGNVKFLRNKERLANGVIDRQASAATKETYGTHIGKVSERCESLLTEIESAQRDALTAQRVGDKKCDENKPMRIHVLEAKIAQHEAEIEKVLSMPVLRTDVPEVDETTFKEENIRLVHELNETIAELHAELAEETEKLKRLQKYLNEHETIQKALSEQLKKFTDSRGRPVKGKSLLTIAKEQRSKIQRNTERLIEILKNFLTTYYPKPTEKRKINVNNLLVDRDYQELRTLLMALMNKYAESNKDKDRYVTITEDHWPPYVELLLKAGIAERHPKEPSLIKIVQFA